MSQSKLRSATSQEEQDCALDMSPMIDMVFLLLIFFIVNATAIIVKTDPDVAPPIAVNSKSQKVKDGRIVVNVHENGTFTAENFNTILKDEVDIMDMVKKEKERCDLLGFTARLHLRGHREAIFEHGRTAIRAAADAGVNQVVFGVYVREP